MKFWSGKLKGLAVEMLEGRLATREGHSAAVVAKASPENETRFFLLAESAKLILLVNWQKLQGESLHFQVHYMAEDSTVDAESLAGLESGEIQKLHIGTSRGLLQLPSCDCVVGTVSSLL